MKKNPHEKSCLNTLNGKQDIHASDFWFFQYCIGFNMIFGDVNLTVHSIMLKESKCFGISRLSFMVYVIKALNCFIVNKVQQQCNDW